jgi:hypothetical protein
VRHPTFLKISESYLSPNARATRKCIDQDQASRARLCECLIFVIDRWEPCWAVCVEAISINPEPSRTNRYQYVIYVSRMTLAYVM